MNSKYFDFIDGLRAIAITAVFLYHLEPTVFTGGFIGVDIFFTISGFLITRLLIERSNNSGFLKSFMLGRIRRLFPAYAVFIILTLIVSVLFLLPNEIKELSRSAVTSSTVVSNIYYYLSADYFNESLNDLALLHTWSLSVEWQFYIFFPLLFCVRLFKTNVFLILLLLTAISLIITTIMAEQDKSAAFFLTQYRVYEFVIGALIATLNIEKIQAFNFNNKNTIFNSLALLSVCGLIIICFLYNKNTVFPGVTAAYVNILTAIILVVGIASPNKTLFKDILNNRYVSYIGKTSYSLYLFHWPVILFAEMYFFGEKSFSFYSTVLGTTLVLSHFSYRFVEQPFRFNRSLNTKIAITAGLFTLLFSSSFFLVTKYTGGLQSRFTAPQLELINTPDWGPVPGDCIATQDTRGYYNCVIGDLNTSPSILVIGDSFAQMLVWALDKKLRTENRSALYITKGGCPPLVFGVSISSSINKRDCYSTQLDIKEAVQNNVKLSEIIMISRWSNFKDSNFDNRFGSPDLNFEQRLIDTLRLFKESGKKITIFQAFPEPGYPVKEWWIRAEKFNHTLSHFEYTSVNELNMLKFQKYVDRIITPVDYLCENPNRCSIHKEQIPLYFDPTHLSKHGAELLITNIAL